MAKERYVKVCPQCGSTDIGTSYPVISGSMFLGDSCRKCGFKGTFPEVEIEKIKDFQKKLNK